MPDQLFNSHPNGYWQTSQEFLPLIRKYRPVRVKELFCLKLLSLFKENHLQANKACQTYCLLEKGPRIKLLLFHKRPNFSYASIGIGQGLFGLRRNWLDANTLCSDPQRWFQWFYPP